MRHIFQGYRLIPGTWFGTGARISVYINSHISGSHTPAPGHLRILISILDLRISVLAQH